MKLIGNWTIVGSVGLSTAIGVPTFTVTPVGSDRKVKSPAVIVEKLTGLLKVTVIALGVTVTVAPLAGLVEATRSRSTALIALMALTRPKPSCAIPGALRSAPFIGIGRLLQAGPDLGRSELGHRLEHERRHGRGVGRGRRRAEEARQVAGATRLVASPARPGTAGCCVSMICPG